MRWFRKNHQTRLYSDSRGARSEWANMPQITTHPDADDDWEVVDISHTEPASLHDYDIIGSVGTGGCATVYKARCRKTKKIVALKVMEKQVYFDAKKLKPDAIMRERDIMVNVTSSDFFAKLHTAFQTETQVVLVQEFLTNGDLLHYVMDQPEKRLDEPTVKFMAAQLLVGLRSLHERGILYRDLKMENILLDDHFNVKLADFGLSRYMDVSNGTNRCFSLAGTLHFIAPEMIKRSGYTASVDYWALGILLYGLLTGTNAFRGDTMDQLFFNIVKETVAFPTDHDDAVVSDAAQDFILCLLQKNPVQRLMGDAVFDHEWFADVDWAAVRGRTAKPPPSMDVAYQPRAPRRAAGRPALLGKPVSSDRRLSPRQQLAFLDFEYRSEDFLSGGSCGASHEGEASSRASNHDTHDSPESDLPVSSLNSRGDVYLEA